MSEEKNIDLFVEQFNEKSKSCLHAITKELASDFIPTPLKTYEEHYKQTNLSLEKSFRGFMELINNVLALLFNEGICTPPSKDDIMKQEDLDFLAIQQEDPDSQEKLLAMVGRVKEFLGLDDKTLMAVYELGFSYYEKQMYSNSSEIFSFLTLLEPLVPAYWFGLAVSQQALKDYQNAILAYHYTLTLKVDAVEALLHLCECYELSDTTREGLLFISQLKKSIHEIEKQEGVEEVLRKAQEYEDKWSKEKN